MDRLSGPRLLAAGLISPGPQRVCGASGPDMRNGSGTLLFPRSLPGLENCASSVTTEIPSKPVHLTLAKHKFFKTGTLERDKEHLGRVGCTFVNANSTRSCEHPCPCANQPLGCPLCPARGVHTHRLSPNSLGPVHFAAYLFS